jgi:nucleotide-binding universal stress UspA family protein
VLARLIRARSAAQALVAEAERRSSDIIVSGAPRRRLGRQAVFGRTVDYVLRHAPCRVMVAASEDAA